MCVCLYCCVAVQVEALLDRHAGEPPVMQVGGLLNGLAVWLLPAAPTYEQMGLAFKRGQDAQATAHFPLVLRLPVPHWCTVLLLYCC